MAGLSRSDTRTAQAALRCLEARLTALSPFLLAYSGGLDSRFLAHTAHRLGIPFLAVHVTGPHISPAESAEALDWARARGIALESPRLDPLGVPQVAMNAPDRCYHCKHSIFSALIALAGKRPVCDGSNLSDHAQYRPGKRALAELGIVSPLADSGFDKPLIREAAAVSGMDRPDQKARPCMLTRLDYGMPVSAELLERTCRAEQAVEDVLRAMPTGCPDFRLRHLREGGSELHVQLAAGTLKGALPALRHVLAASGFGGAEVLAVDSLSGFFDRRAGLAG